MKNYINELHYKKKPNIAEWAILVLLISFSLVYRLAVVFRNFLYNVNLLKSEKLSAYVVSIGNLTTGGTGKTPITAKLAVFFY